MQLFNGRVALELHTLSSAGQGPALLLLHEIGGSAADFAAAVPSWAGPVHALDFSGHGHSGRVHGGGYYPELLVSDADIALSVIGEACVAGVGLGAYVALLLSAARSSLVPAALLWPGAGLEGGGAQPDLQRRWEYRHVPTAGVEARSLQQAATVDPAALALLSGDLRPVDYAEELAQAARRILLADDGAEKPPWWRSVAALPSVRSVKAASFAEALSQLAP